MNAPARFKQSDPTRAVRGALKAGMRVTQAEIEAEIAALNERAAA